MSTIKNAIIGTNQLRNLLRDCVPTWTNMPPCREGFYFMRADDKAEVTVVRVRIDFGEHHFPLVVQEGDPARTGVQYLQSYAGHQWAGPIEEPAP